MAKRPIVCDTTVLLYLSRIGRIDLLRTLFSAVYVPEAVLLELDTGRLLRRTTIDPRDIAWMTPASVPERAITRLPENRLGMGEQSVIAYAHTHPGHLVGLDDLQARRLAEALDLPLAGTLGILLRAKQAGLVDAVRPLLDAVVEAGFHLEPDLYQEVLRLAEEDR